MASVNSIAPTGQAGPSAPVQTERNLLKCAPCRNSRKICVYEAPTDTCERCAKSQRPNSGSTPFLCTPKTPNTNKRGPNKPKVAAQALAQPAEESTAEGRVGRTPEPTGAATARSLSPRSAVKNATLDQLAAVGTKRSAEEAGIADLDAQIDALKAQREAKKSKIAELDTKKAELETFLEGSLASLFTLG